MQIQNNGKRSLLRAKFMKRLKHTKDIWKDATDARSTDTDEERQIIILSGEVVCEPPNNRLNRFEGRLNYKGQTFPLDNNRMLLRGCRLKNTRWCYGLVVFAGRDSKLMMNSGRTKFKRTSLDRFLNILIMGVGFHTDLQLART